MTNLLLLTEAVLRTADVEESLSFFDKTFLTEALRSIADVKESLSLPNKCPRCGHSITNLLIRFNT